MRPSLILRYGLLMLAVSNNLQAQQQPAVKTISKNGSTIEIKTAIQRDGQPLHHFIVEAPLQQKNGLPVERRVLVKFKGDPLAKKSSKNGSAISQSLNQEHARFIRDLQQLSSRAKAAGKIEPQILHEFKTVFNGYALIISSDVENEIRKLPYVASVVDDHKVEAIDESSNQVIKADQVWAGLNITGRGVVIGIIDTGIDYNHTDLGNGIGNSFKVLGGYDFVNNDNDPMDDHGHGTHVAGIAAANGSIKGVAPDAKLMAFKVLDAGGSGWDSWIIAGIERSVDPDQNSATNDAVDVVNMSLGRAPMPNDPYTEAIANATALGVTFVVAAGNSGNYFTVGAPGVAPDAITVGATELNDLTAIFSSKGPTEFDYLIKPDVSAPGVAINSTFLQNQFVQLNGTSMASPHVAGAAALLLEKNPSWTPEMIKGALMNNAKPATDSHWSQGTGRIDALKSIQAPFIVTLGSISLGKYNALQPEQKTFITTIYNTSNQVKEFSISATGDIVNANVAVQIQPSSATLNPGQSKEIAVTFNTTVGLPYKSFTEGYYGTLLVSSAGETVTVPIALVHAKTTRLIFSTPLPNAVHVMGTNGSEFYKGFVPTLPEAEVIIPNVDIEVVASYGNMNNVYVVKKITSEAIGADVILTRELAKNRIVFGFKDVNDERIAIDPFLHAGSTLFSTERLLGLYLFPVDTFFVSDNSAARLDMLAWHTDGNTFYDLSAGVPPGQNDNITIIKRADTPFDIKRNGENAYQWQYTSAGSHAGKGGISLQNLIPFESNNQIRIFFAERKSTDNFSFSKVVLMDQNEPTSETGLFGLYENDLIKFTDQFFIRNKSVEYKSEHFTYELGNSLLRWNGRMTNQANEIRLYDAPFVGLFNYGLNERNIHELEYELKTDGQVINTGKLLNRMSPAFDSYEPILKQTVTPGQYSLSVKSTKHKVYGIDGYAQIDLEFDTRKEIKNPPVLSLFSLKQEGLTTNKIESGQHASIVIGLSNCIFGSYCDSEDAPNSAKLFIKSDVTDWQELELIRLKHDTLVADINEALPQGYYSAKVVATDIAGNSFTYTLSPAFFVSPAAVPPVTRINLLQPLNHANNIVPSPFFKWESVAAVSYTFELSKSSTFSVIESTITQTESELLFPSTLNYNTIYYWRVKPNYENSSGAWSDVFDFRSIEHRTRLLFPENESVQNIFNFLTFEWEGITGSNYYEIQVARDPHFTSIELITGTFETVLSSWIMPEDGVTYYWRVRSYLNSGINTSWSEVFSFTGDLIPEKVQLSYPLDDSEIPTRKPILYWSNAYMSISYTLQISRHADFSQLVTEQTSDLATLTLDEPLNSAGTFYWRVRANYVDKSGEWSDAFRFTIQEDELILVQPQNNSSWVNASRVYFTWEQVSFASRYHFQLSRDSQFSSIEYESEGNVSTLEWSTFAEADVVYYWRVRPYSIFEYYGDWSETFSFTGQSDGYITSLVWPENNSINVDRQTFFDWSKSGYAQSYTFQISKSADFSSIDHETETLGDVELPDLDFSTKYYWRVRAQYENETRPWSEVFNFRVHDLLLTLKSPVHQSTQTNSSIDFEWDQLNHVNSYQLQVSTDENFTSTEIDEEVIDVNYTNSQELERSSTYYWRVRPHYILDYFGEWSVPFSFTTDIVTSLPEQINDSKKPVAYPNPFTTGTTVEFYVARAGEVSLEILNSQGQVIDRLTKFFPLAGRQSLQWKGNDIVPGVYLCKITTADKTEVVKLMRGK